MSDKPKTRFLIYALGIFFCYFVFGILQEKITRGRYGDEVNEDGSRGERFTFALALVGVQCVVNWAFAKGMLLVWQQKKDETHPGYYASCSLTYLLAMVGSNMALRWVPYPTQVVGKAAKPIPVMILAVLIGRKSYPLSRYLCVLTIVLGVVLFMYKDGKSSAVDEEGTGLGELLLILSLAMDGLTGAIQERMRASSAPSAQHMMLAMNGWSSAMVAIPLVISGEALSFIQFTINHPILIWHLTTLALTGALGQLFIFLMVSGFGPLACSVVTTTRKFFTVLFSVLIFGNPLIPRQWAGAILVFLGLFSDIFINKKPPAPPQATKKPLMKEEH
ncbi:solute carrier family 35 member B1 homolog [Lutzomyia longipalpis]|uniref:solute carrier family 35 member B1 homolog n=1 Tax=Lutzomyia longipalpis TaxID=7200 RepID=UPI002483324B|nr:solute carrier family 35 member B1 homolog [Lutzomyia longipalpis]